MLESGKLTDIVTWTDRLLKIGDQQAPVDSNVPSFCYPNPFNSNRYLIVNSGLTFREAHDKTNSLQNPKLPDWAILDISQPPTQEAAGKIVAADFFDRQWKVIGRVKSPTDRNE
jgi:hypothetical protein